MYQKRKKEKHEPIGEYRKKIRKKKQKKKIIKKKSSKKTYEILDIFLFRC